jgi:hypothetical protein
MGHVTLNLKLAYVRLVWPTNFTQQIRNRFLIALHHSLSTVI